MRAFATVAGAAGGGWFEACAHCRAVRAARIHDTAVHTHKTHTITTRTRSQDEDGIKGICLQRTVVPTAGKAISANLHALAPLVLPLRELLACMADAAYVPDFHKV